MEIKNGEEYAVALAQLCRAAEYIERCEEGTRYERALMRYDEICNLIQKYRSDEHADS